MPLVPKPPPTSGGAITRTRSSGTPSWPAITPRWRCTICTAPHTVSDSPSQRATRPRGSSGCAPPRDSRTRVFTTTGAEAMRGRRVAHLLPPLRHDIAPDLVVHDRRPRGDRPLDVDHGRQRLVLDANQVERIVRPIRIVRHHDRHRLPHESHPIPGQHRDAARNGQRGMRRIDGNRPPDGPQIRRHEDPDHAGRPPRRRRVDRDDARMGMRRPQHRRVQTARHAQIIDELPRPRDEPRILPPPHGPGPQLEPGLRMTLRRTDR